MELVARPGLWLPDAPPFKLPTSVGKPADILRRLRGMAMAFGTTAANKIQDHYMGRTAYTLPTPYFALYTASPGAGGVASTNEVAYTTYARVANPAGGSSLMAATAAGSSANTAAITFPIVTSGGPVTITYVALVSSSSGTGDIIAFAALTTSRTFANGDTPSFPIGALTITST